MSGAVSLLGMGPVAHQPFDQDRSVAANLCGLLDQARRGGVGIVLMRLRHVFVDGDVTSPLRRPAVTGDALVIMEDLDDPACEPDIDLAANQAVRHGVEGLIDLDMIVGMNLCRFPFGIFEWRCWQGGERVAFDRFEELMSGFANTPHRPVIEIVEELADPHIEINEAEEALIPQSRQDPALNDQNAAFDLGFLSSPGLQFVLTLKPA